MKRLFCFLGALATVLFSTFINPCVALAQGADHFLPLDKNWRIQTAALAGMDQAAVSSAACDTANWCPASVPTTVLAALVNDGIYTNIFFGTNLAAIPSAPFTNAWWFRKEFSVPKELAAENADLIFEGINYRANIWLNGEQIAATNDTFGAFRTFNFAVGGRLKPGENILSVEIFPPQRITPNRLGQHAGYRPIGDTAIEIVDPCAPCRKPRQTFG